MQPTQVPAPAPSLFYPHTREAVGWVERAQHPQLEGLGKNPGSVSYGDLGEITEPL